MKLQILSDLHMDSAAWEPPATNADVIVVAGDLYDDGIRSMHWCAALRERTGKPVVVIAGNHEFFKANLAYRLKEMRSIAKQADVHLLQNNSVVIDGIRFVGSTLWSDFLVDGEGFAPIAMNAAQDLIGDFMFITVGDGSGQERRLSPQYARRMHRRTLRALERGLENAYSEKVVVVTHHAPSLKSISDGFAGSALNGAFASNLDDFAAYGMAKLWVHGHMHHSSDYMLGSTRVVCNPRGGGRYVNASFDPSLVLEV